MQQTPYQAAAAAAAGHIQTLYIDAARENVVAIGEMNV